MDMANEVNDIWTDVSKTNSFLVNEDKLAVMVEMMLSVVPPAHVRLFLNTIPYKAPQAYHDTLSEEERTNLELFIESFTKQINDKFGTKPYTHKEVLVSPRKVKKERDKPTIKANVKPSLKSKGIPNKLKKKIRIETELDRLKKRLPIAKPYAVDAIKRGIKTLEQKLKDN